LYQAFTKPKYEVYDAAERSGQIPEEALSVLVLNPLGYDSKPCSETTHEQRVHALKVMGCTEEDLIPTAYPTAY
jgi:hypothetical protein